MPFQVDPTMSAGRVSVWPLDYVSGGTNYGSYRSVLVSGATVSLTAGDPILSFRWTSTVANAVLHRIIVNANVTSNITTAVNFDLQALFARGFTAADSAGTASLPPAAMQKSKTVMGNSLVGDLRIATTGKLTAGTRTLDTYGFGFLNIQLFPNTTNVGSCSYPAELYRWDVAQEYPVTFGANEGFIVQAVVAGNTSGGMRYTFTLDWAEVPVASNSATGSL